jgi:ligand-binding sensor domain-containing protein
LPQNGISEVVQTPDGYLWLAIAEGIARFDGVRFTAFDTENTPQIKSNNVQSLLVDRSGTLWIGTHGGGLSRYKDGQFAHFSTSEGLSALFVKCLFEDHLGNLWVGTDGGGLNLFRDGKFTVYSTAEGLPDDHINTINEDVSGTLLVGTAKGLYFKRS